MFKSMLSNWPNIFKCRFWNSKLEKTIELGFDFLQTKLPNFNRVQIDKNSPKLTLCCCLSFRPSEEGGVLKLTPGQQDNSARKLWISTLVWNKSDFCWLRLMMELCKNKNMLLLGVTFFFSIFGMILFWRGSRGIRNDRASETELKT